MPGINEHEALPADHDSMWCDRCGFSHQGACPPVFGKEDDDPWWEVVD